MGSKGYLRLVLFLSLWRSIAFGGLAECQIVAQAATEPDFPFEFIFDGPNALAGDLVAQASGSGGTVTLYRGIQGRFRFFTSREQAEWDTLSPRFEEHMAKHGAVGLPNVPGYQRYLELRRMRGNQNFTSVERDAMEHYAGTDGWVVAITLPRNIATPYLASPGMSLADRYEIPGESLLQLVRRYPFRLYRANR